MKIAAHKQYIKRALASLLGVALSTPVTAGVNTEPGVINATSVAALTLTIGATMDFGTIVAIGNSAPEIDGSGSLAGGTAANQAASAFIAMDLAGNLAVGQGTSTGRINNLSATGTPGTFSVGNGANNVPVRFTSTAMLDFDSTSASIVIDGPGAGTDPFTFTDLILCTSACPVASNPSISDGYTGTVWGVTDGSGNVSVTTAGRLYTTTLGTDGQVYGDGLYSGVYSLTVSY